MNKMRSVAHLMLSILIFTIVIINTAKGAQAIPGSALQDAINVAIAQGLPSYSLAAGGTYEFTNASLSVRGSNNFDLDGAGATLIFNPGFGVLIRESKFTSIRNLTSHMTLSALPKESLLLTTTLHEQ